MDTLKEKKDSAGKFLFYYADVNQFGSRFRLRLGRNKRAAQKRFGDILAKIDKEIPLKEQTSKVSVEQLFTKYTDLKLQQKSPHTQDRYRAVLDNFKRFLNQDADTKLSDIAQLTLETFDRYKNHRQKKEGASDKTLNLELTLIRTIFKWGVKWKHLKANPTDDLEIPKPAREIPRFLDREQIDNILKAAGPFMYRVIYFLLNSGLRKGELENLTWADVDFTRRKIKVQHKADWTTKTKSEREVPINPALFDVLTKHRAEANGCPMVFHVNGEKIDENYLRREFMKITKGLGYKNLTRVHDLRHSFASYLVMNGVDLPTVKTLMGHRSIQTTMIYAHVSDGHASKAVEKLNF